MDCTIRELFALATQAASTTVLMCFVALSRAHRHRRRRPNETLSRAESTAYNKKHTPRVNRTGPGSTRARTNALRPAAERYYYWPGVGRRTLWGVLGVVCVLVRMSWLMLVLWLNPIRRQHHHHHRHTDTRRRPEKTEETMVVDGGGRRGRGQTITSYSKYL